MDILGVGYAYPETIVSNEVLKRLSPDLTQDMIFKRTGIKSRRSVLPLNYILTTGNQDLFRSPQVALENPTDLAYRASVMAIERAGIKAEEIGLIVGDSNTPIQSTPSEAQRVGKRFKLKVPAYDVTSSAGMLSLYLSNFLSWKEEKFPSYVLCVTTNTPSQHICYNSSCGAQREASLFLGDGAGAMIISKSNEGKLKVKSSKYLRWIQQEKVGQLNTYGFFELNSDAYLASMKGMYEEISKDVKSSKILLSSKVACIGTRVLFSSGEDLNSHFGQGGFEYWERVSYLGDTIGATPLITLGEKWNEIKSRQNIICISAGLGGGYGYAILEGR